MQGLLRGGALDIGGVVYPIASAIESDDPEVLTDRFLRWPDQGRVITAGQAITPKFVAPAESEISADEIPDNSIPPSKALADTEAQKLAWLARIEGAHAGDSAFNLDQADATHPDGLRIPTLERVAEHTSVFRWQALSFQYQAIVALRTGVTGRLDYSPVGQSGENPGVFSLSTTISSTNIANLFADGRTPTHLEIETDANGDGSYATLVSVAIERDPTAQTFLWVRSTPALGTNPTELGGSGNVPFRFNFLFSDGTRAWPQVPTVVQKTLTPEQVRALIREPSVDQVTYAGTTLSVRTRAADGTQTTETYTIEAGSGGGGGTVPDPVYQTLSAQVQLPCTDAGNSYGDWTEVWRYTNTDTAAKHYLILADLNPTASWLTTTTTGGDRASADFRAIVRNASGTDVQTISRHNYTYIRTAGGTCLLYTSPSPRD